MENETKEVKTIPNSAFDIEYRTQWRDEVDFLAERGIYYTIRKREGDYGIPTYKYTRTAELFLALADFYLHRFPNRKSLATFKGPEKKFEQQSFLNDDGSIKKQYIVNKNNDVKNTVNNEIKNTIRKIKPEVAAVQHNVLDLEKIKAAQALLRQAEDQVGKEKLAMLTAGSINIKPDTSDVNKAITEATKQLADDTE